MNEAPRAALDIKEYIEAIIHNYPPLRESRPYLNIAVNDAGVVTFGGNLRTAIIRRVLVDSTRQVPGVTVVNDDLLYDDDALLVAAGRLLPPGVYLTAVNGALVLSGRALEPEQAAGLQEKIAAIPGVRVVKTDFYALQAAG